MPSLQHIVLIRLNDKCGPQDVANFNQHFTKIVAEIDGMICGSITAVEFAEKFKTTNKGGYTHCVVCLFDNIEALDVYYNTSSEHKTLKSMVHKFMDGAAEDNILEFDSWNPSLPSNLNALITKSLAESARDDSKEMEEKSEEQKSNPLEDELAALKLKFGALKWAEVQEKGYPQPRRDDKVVDIYKNAKDESVEVNDAYRWLEDPDSTETREWIDQQVCFSYKVVP